MDLEPESDEEGALALGDDASEHKLLGPSVRLAWTPEDADSGDCVMLGDDGLGPGDDGLGPGGDSLGPGDDGLGPGEGGLGPEEEGCPTFLGDDGLGPESEVVALVLRSATPGGEFATDPSNSEDGLALGDDGLEPESDGVMTRELDRLSDVDDGLEPDGASTLRSDHDDDDVHCGDSVFDGLAPGDVTQLVEDSVAIDDEVSSDGELSCGSTFEDEPMPGLDSRLPQILPKADGQYCFRWADRTWSALKIAFGEERLVKRLCGRSRNTVGTYFSGLGSAEVALSMLAAAAPVAVRARMTFEVEFACEKATALHDVLFRRSSGCVFADILDQLEGLARNQTVTLLSQDFEAGHLKIWGCRVLRHARCARHKVDCQVPFVWFDISGSPCLPWSRASGPRRLLRRHGAVIFC